MRVPIQTSKIDEPSLGSKVLLNSVMHRGAEAEKFRDRKESSFKTLIMSCEKGANKPFENPITGNNDRWTKKTPSPTNLSILFSTLLSPLDS